MLPFRLIYSDAYDLKLGVHVFPARKYRLIHDRLLEEGFAEPSDFLEPQPITDDEVMLVHGREWVTKLKTGRLTYEEILQLEIPFSHDMVAAVWRATGGTLLAAERALAGDRIGINLGGGFHHAFPDHGEGFCPINDIAVAIRSLQRRGVIRKAMVIDCDVHHGNGTAAIFAGDPMVSTISIHQYNNYPARKPPSTIDIHLEDGVGDEEYLRRLRETCQLAIPGYRPDLLYYVAGADPYQEDQLGGLNLTIEGLMARDRLVFDLAQSHRVPVAVVLAGGYAIDTNDTVAIHCNTIRVPSSGAATNPAISAGHDTPGGVHSKAE